MAITYLYQVSVELFTIMMHHCGCICAETTVAYGSNFVMMHAFTYAGNIKDNRRVSKVRLDTSRLRVINGYSCGNMFLACFR